MDHVHIGSSETSTAGTADGPGSSVAKPLSGLRALFVDDEDALARLIASYFERAGFKTKITGDGLEAVARAREFDPDVIAPGPRTAVGPGLSRA